MRVSNAGVGHVWETVVELRPSKNRTRVVCMKCGFRTYLAPDFTGPPRAGDRYTPPSDCDEYIIQNVMNG